MGFLTEFKQFIAKGNVLDLAVGVIIGGAFGKIVTSLTEDVIMPVVGLATGRLGTYGDYKAIQLGPMKVGSFLSAVLSFFIIAFCVFLIVKAANRLRTLKPAAKEADPAPAPPAPAPSKEEVLLTEIRDALRANRP